jgi:two-component system, OmpR family, sensor histidine kinase VicK
MACLTRNLDWSGHPLGTPEEWPQSLKNSLATILSNKFPMFIWWGPELYCFYNDAYRPSLGNDGKHPSILGQPAREAWPEIWPVIGPLIGQVMSGGESVWSEDQLIPIYRNGRMEDVYWTFSYGPLFNDDGEIGGVLVTCAETTEKVRAYKALHEQERQLHNTIRQAPAAMAIFRGPDLTVRIANERALEMWGRTAEEVMHKPLLEAMPELVDQGIGELLKGVYGTGQAVVANEHPFQLLRDGSLVPTYISFVYDAVRAPDGRIDGVLAMGVDVTASVLARQKAEASEEQFRLLANSMPQFVWTADAKGTLNYFNPSVYAYSGLSAAEVAREGWLQIVHPDDREENVNAWSRSVQSGEDFIFEHRFRRHDGTYRWQLSRAVPLRHSDGSIRMWVGTSTDIQDIKEQEEEKDYFISMASHELRTPLSTMKGFVEMLRVEHGDGPDTALIAALDVLDRQLGNLTGIISDLLDHSRIRTGNLELELAPIDLNGIVRSVIGEFALVNASHDITLHGGDEAMVLADEGRIAQVLQNLLTNAVKYAPDSREITVNSIVRDGQVTIEVIDKGIGISRADQQKLFRRFFRVEGHSQRNFSGFGIGLYLVADIIQRHGGSVGVKSEPGAGSTFRFTLPLHCAE